VQLITWCKPNSGCQPIGCAKSATEFLLYARRGSHPFRTTRGFKTFYVFESTAIHSEKPLEMYKELARVTSGRRLDLYGRNDIPGFHSWGRGTPGQSRRP
jgi:N6-adenosine-specific RNA methylase IME4